MPSVIIHGHFYQPPRENPWTGIIEEQPGAAPFHDWNERIHAECYWPNAFVQSGPDESINNYENISFNFGPTLLSWLQEHHLGTYQRILDADRKSVATRGGHGNAIAQAYGHAILPLCNDRDRLTQVLWGLADFRFRFQREAESLWLSETACNDQTLDLLIEQGLRYVILAPRQAKRMRAISGEWRELGDGEIDTSQAYLYRNRTQQTRSLAVFFYHGPLAQAIAFENALRSSELLVSLLKHAAGNGPLVNVATDGETYGHHFKFGDLALAHALEIEAKNNGLAVTNYGEFLDQHVPEIEVEISAGSAGEGSSWSCVHGVSRWARDCGCHTGGQDGWNQSWREPLREALNFLRDALSQPFEELGRELFHDPWDARNFYVELLLSGPVARKAFFQKHARRDFSVQDEERALTLLEMQRNLLLMFTSCGWFFSELSGIETIQILRYAARALELAEDLEIQSPRSRFLEILAKASSNNRELGNGAQIFENLVETGASAVVA
jgi:alpha-amylase/alpha-mannosidase (GH57 family)